MRRLVLFIIDHQPMTTNLDYVTERLLSKDKKVVIATLTTLKAKLEGKKPPSSISSTQFKTIVSFLKQPNLKILNLALSILANCCIQEIYRKYFKETDGIRDLLVILKSVANDDIACRAWRLAGNLSITPELCTALVNKEIIVRAADYIAQIETISSGTRLMVFRTIRKCWMQKSLRNKILSGGNFMKRLQKCLVSKDEEVVILSVQCLTLMLSHANAVVMDKTFIVQIVELSKNEKFHLVTIKCLAAIVSSYVIAHIIEGSGLAEVYIDYFKSHDHVEKTALEAFCKLCREGGVRNKVKNAEMFPALIKLCRGPNVPLLLMTFLYFQYDQPSIQVLSQSEDLICILVQNIGSSHAVELLTVIARLETPVLSLVSESNLDVFVESGRCGQLLSIIAGSRKYFKTILLSGRVWAICKAGCSMDEVGNSGYGEGVLEHCLIIGDEKRRKIVSLAVPFLVKPRNFKLLYKFLARHHAMNIILQALNDWPVEDGTIASVVRLAQLFREHHNKDEVNDFDEAQLLFLENVEDDAETEKMGPGPIKPQNCNDRVTFELDNGSCVTANKQVLCSNSPVMDAMLNGHFVESGQQTVRLQDCSRAALTSLGLLLEGRLLSSSLDIQVHLELISLTDRLLIPTLSDALTRAVPLSGANCAQVYLWSRDAGHAPNVSRLRARAYWALLSSPAQLQPALGMQSCREPLLAEISVFLESCLNDLL